MEVGGALKSALDQGLWAYVFALILIGYLIMKDRQARLDRIDRDKTYAEQSNKRAELSERTTAAMQGIASAVQALDGRHAALEDRLSAIEREVAALVVELRSTSPRRAGR